MSALSEVLDPYRRRIARDTATLSRAMLAYATATVDDAEPGAFTSSRIRRALDSLDSNIAAARRRVRALPRDTPGRGRAYNALGTLAQGYAELEESLKGMGTQEGIDAATSAEGHLAAGGEQLDALRRYLR